MARKSALGSGLENIFGENVIDVLDEIQSTAKGDEYGRKAIINIQDIHLNPYQPRKEFNQEKLQELAQSISTSGVFTPIIVRESNTGGYQLVTGERRLRASQLANKTTIPAIIMDLDDQQMMEISLLENIQREDLNVVEEANAYQKLMEQLNLTQQQLADKMGKSREHVANTLRLLKLPQDVLKFVSEGKLTMGQVRPLITLPEDKASSLAKRIYNEGLSARAVESILANSQQPKDKPAVVKSPYISDIENKLKDKYATKVKLTNNNIVISFHNNQDLNRILKLLGIIEE